ncbi:MAG: DUF4142 domain-containing protein [Ginsengibacter sp.]
MKKIKSVATLLIGGALLLSACNGNNSATTSSDSTSTTSTMADTSHPMSSMNSDTSHMNSMAVNVDADTKDFMEKAAQGGMMEVALGNDVANKANSQDVKDFGKMMVDDHTMLNNKMKDMATHKNVMLPAAVSADQQKEMDELNKKTGKDWDKSYVKMMVNDHKKDIADFKKAASNLKDADVSQFAKDALPTLQKHLDAIEKINKKM